MATGLSLSSTSNLTNGQRIMIASAKEAFEPAAPDPDLIESERIPTGTKQWDISTAQRMEQSAQATSAATRPPPGRRQAAKPAEVHPPSLVLTPP